MDKVDLVGCRWELPPVTKEWAEFDRDYPTIRIIDLSKGGGRAQLDAFKVANGTPTMREKYPR
jgi:hypothetical protein